MPDQLPSRLPVSVKATYWIPNVTGDRSEKTEFSRVFDGTNTKPEVIGLPEETEAKKVNKKSLDFCFIQKSHLRS